MEIVELGEIERRYPDEWVLVEITRDHRDARRAAGHLLAHSPKRATLDELHTRFRAAHPGARLFEFYTGALVADEGVTVIL